MNNKIIALNILIRAGLTKKLGHYYKSGVNKEDLNDLTLLSIFNDLNHLDPTYSLEYVELVKKMRTMGAYEFIINFMKFAKNDFSSEEIELVNSFREEKPMQTMFDLIPDKNSNLNKMNISEDIKNKFLENVSAYTTDLRNKLTSSPIR